MYINHYNYYKNDKNVYDGLKEYCICERVNEEHIRTTLVKKNELFKNIKTTIIKSIRNFKNKRIINKIKPDTNLQLLSENKIKSY